MPSLLRQPLLHFCVIGGLFYAAVSLLNPQEDAPGQTIIVSQDRLLTFIQQRTQIFEPKYAAAKLAAMSANERAVLIAQYVEEEALFREAQRLGLAEQDYVIRRRMVQKMEYAASNAGAYASFSEAQVSAYFQANRLQYETPDTVSFDQIYLPDASQAARVAQALKTDDPATLGARFAYGRSFNELSVAETADIFGEGFAAHLMEVPVDAAAWQGPIASQHGLHFVQLRGRGAGGIPALEDVRKAVEADMLYEAQNTARQDAVRAIIKSYSVRDETSA
jgi:parvulin-like peptidyl-prolyl isomerase